MSDAFVKKLVLFSVIEIKLGSFKRLNILMRKGMGHTAVLAS